MMSAMNVLDALGSSAAGARSLAPRPASLRGVVVGVLDNAKPNARGLMMQIEIRNPPRYAGLRDDASVAITDRWEHLMVIVAGGAGKHSAVMFTFGSTRAITRRIDG